MAISRRWNFVLFVVSAVAMVLAVVAGIRSQQFAACQAHYNEINNVRTRSLTEVAAKEREAERGRGDALDAVLLDPALLRPSSDRTPAERDRIRRLFAEYITAANVLRAERAAADKARAANPVPPPPSQTCAG